MNQFPVFLLYLSIAAAGLKKDSAHFRDTSYIKSSHHKMTIADILKKHTDEWMSIPGVTGTGEGKSGGKSCIFIFIEYKSEMIRKKIPKAVEGYKVVLQQTGEIKAR